MIGSRRVAAISALFACQACTSLSTSTDIRPSSATQATTGVPYSLPMLQYELKVTRALAQCVKPGTSTPALEFALTAEATPAYVAGETYVIDYRRLAGATKISSFAIEFQDNSNLLKSINAQVEDRTADIASNLFKSAIGVASLAAGIPQKAAAPDREVVGGMLVCADGAQAKLDAVTLATAEVKARSEKLKAATAAVEALSSRAASLSDADKTKLTQLVAEQQDATKALATAQAALAEANKAISLTSTLRWPRAFDVTDGPLEPEAEVSAKLATLVRWQAGRTGENGERNRCDDATKVATCLKDKLTLFVKLDQLTPAALAAPRAPAGQDRRRGGEAPGGIVTASATGSRGVFVRPPIQGRLLVCGDASKLDCGDNGPDLLLRTDDASVPQLGTLRFLPFTNGAFQNNSLTLTLARSGDVAKLEYKEPKAQGETISAAALSAIGDLRGFSDARTAQRAADAKTAHDAVTAARADEIATIQFQIDQLQKQRALADLTQQPASATAAVQAQTAETAARVALLQAQLAEKQAQAALAQ